VRVVIAGSRDGGFGVEDVAAAVVAAGFVVGEVVSGAARGVDRLGEQWAAARGIRVVRFPADWSRGRGAGYLRNLEMAAYGDALVALWDGRSSGTRHMIQTMRKLGKPVFVAGAGGPEHVEHVEHASQLSLV